MKFLVSSYMLDRTIMRRFCDGVSSAEVVSFDIFDTLVGRRCLLPTDVFFHAAMAQGLGRRGALGFRTDRIEAERQARASSVAGEVTLADIYSCLPQNGHMGRNALMEAEIAAERALCRPVERGVRMFGVAKEMGKTVVLTTDMYLPRGVIEGLLAQCGVSGYDELFLSCERGAGKRSGGLFRLMAGQLKAETSAIVHVGDSPSADIRGALRAGVRPFFVPRRNMVGRALVGLLPDRFTAALRF